MYNVICVFKMEMKMNQFSLCQCPNIPLDYRDNGISYGIKNNHNELNVAKNPLDHYGLSEK